MDVTAWVCEAQSGNVVGRMPLAHGASFSSRFGGGAFTAQVPLGTLRTRDGSGPDLPAIRDALAWCDGGKHTLLLTEGDRTLGEWLIWTHTPATPDGMMTISGFEWDGYPKFRSLNDDYVYKTATDIGTITRRLLQDAFSSYQSTQITVPAFTAGRTTTIEHKSHTAYYQDVLDELEAVGVEWRVQSEAVWSGGAAVRADRTVLWGAPEITRSTSTVLRYYDPHSRAGNLARFERSRDFSKYAQSMYGWGGGEGAKQRWVGLSDPTLTNQGYLIVTKNETFPGKVLPAQLTQLTQHALDEAQYLWGPTDATVDSELIPAWPRVGDRVSCQIGWSWSYPDGFDGTLRVGEVAFKIGTDPAIDLQLA